MQSGKRSVESASLVPSLHHLEPKSALTANLALVQCFRDRVGALHAQRDTSAALAEGPAVPLAQKDLFRTPRPQLNVFLARKVVPRVEQANRYAMNVLPGRFRL